MTPAPTPRHQTISSELYVLLRSAARAAGLHVLEAVNVRLRPGRIPIPDLVITGDIDLDEPIIDASAVRLVCEITSPSNPATDRVLKLHFYATAGIPWYLLVEQRTGELHLYRRDGEHYLEHSVTRRGQVLRLVQPVVAEIDPNRLLPPA